MNHLRIRLVKLHEPPFDTASAAPTGEHWWAQLEERRWIYGGYRWEYVAQLAQGGTKEEARTKAEQTLRQLKAGMR